MDIELLLSFKNYVVIKDLKTEYVWLYSYNKPLLYYDGLFHIIKPDLTNTNKKHKEIFKKWLADYINSGNI